MNCKFTIPYTMNIYELMELGIKEASDHEGHFNGNINSGDFNIAALGGRFVGYYSVNKNTINVTISSKPFFVPCFAIESFLRLHIR